MAKHGLDRPIHEPTINRPGLALAGFFTYFAPKRIQVFGHSEMSYLRKLTERMRAGRFDKLCEQNIPCLVLARGHKLPEDLAELARQQRIPVLGTKMVTMNFVNAATFHLENDFAPSTTLHGCMVDIRGVGVLITGKSGSGKSETAIGLLERGAALVADDIVQVRLVGGELIARAPELSRGYLEMRGIGIINAANLFGLSSIRPEKRLDLVVTLKPHADLNSVDRLGLQEKNYQVLGPPGPPRRNPDRPRPRHRPHGRRGRPRPPTPPARLQHGRRVQPAPPRQNGRRKQATALNSPPLSRHEIPAIRENHRILKFQPSPARIFPLAGPSPSPTLAPPRRL